jgi:hypothetical protein
MDVSPTVPGRSETQISAVDLNDETIRGDNRNNLNSPAWYMKDTNQEASDIKPGYFLQSREEKLIVKKSLLTRADRDAGVTWLFKVFCDVKSLCLVLHKDNGFRVPWGSL